MPRRIYLATPHLGDSERKFVEEALDTNWVSTVGPHLGAFEEEMGARLGRYCVAVSSGTAAIHLALRLVGVEAGDEVLCPTFTFVASANPIRYLGATPVFLDCERASWNLDPNLLETALKDRERLGRRPKALVAVGLFGQCPDMEPVRDLCDRHGVAIVEDAAESLGSDYRGEPAGALGAVSALSFNGNKIITTSGGGMVTTSSERWAQQARHWATQARDPGLSYEHSELGYNYRLSNVLAGIGRGQLQVLDQRIEQKRQLAERYRAAFEALPGFELAPEAEWGRHTRWLSCFTLAPGHSLAPRDIIETLAKDEIEARPVWKPMHQQPLFAGAEVYGGAVSDDLFARGLCLPSSTNMTDEQEARVVRGVLETFASSSRKPSTPTSSVEVA